jgi:hypothetical protein
MPRNSEAIELIEYYKKHNITDYPKNKNGDPNMSKPFNKFNYLKVLDSKLPIKNQEPEDCCVICSEPFLDKCILSCGHTFCVSCSIKHFRKNENCPMCRKQICDKPKELIAMPEEITNSYIDTIFETKEDTRQNLNVRDYIYNAFEYYKYNSILNKERYIQDICEEIKLCILDFNESAIEWYTS